MVCNSNGLVSCLLIFWLMFCGLSVCWVIGWMVCILLWWYGLIWWCLLVMWWCDLIRCVVCWLGSWVLNWVLW